YLEVDGESTQRNGNGNADAETAEPDISVPAQPDIPPVTQPPSASQSAKSSKTPRIYGQWTSSGLPVDFQWISSGLASGLPVDFQWTSSGLASGLASGTHFGGGQRRNLLLRTTDLGHHGAHGPPEADTGN
ncbi:hypothetical protein E4U44_000796, partial [Claviceps purpurea]